MLFNAGQDYQRNEGDSGYDNGKVSACVYRRIKRCRWFVSWHEMNDIVVHR